jgi:hypothetical protein
MIFLKNRFQPPQSKFSHGSIKFEAAKKLSTELGQPNEPAIAANEWSEVALKAGVIANKAAKVANSLRHLSHIFLFRRPSSTPRLLNG